MRGELWMITRSGATYKRSSNMDQTLKSMEQMMLQLVEDRHKREEFAAEWAGWERAAEKRIEAMQAQTEALMTLVRDSHKAEPPTTKMVPYLLFAYREVPQASTRFHPLNYYMAKMWEDLWTFWRNHGRPVRKVMKVLSPMYSQHVRGFWRCLS